MSRPEVTLENYEEVYKYYAQHEPSKLALKGLHRAASLLYRPHIRYANGAADRITELLETNHRLIMACNHVNVMDQFPAAVALQKKPLKPVVGNTVTLAKQPYFTNPVLRRSFDTIGCIPTYRKKDMQDGDPKLRMKTASKLIETVATRIESGNHVFLFPEGTRNRKDPAELGKIEHGIGHIAFKGARLAPVAVLPMALWYGKNEHTTHPNIYIDMPIEGPFRSPAKANESIATAMAYSLEMARGLEPFALEQVAPQDYQSNTVRDTLVE